MPVLSDSLFRPLEFSPWTSTFVVAFLPLAFTFILQNDMDFERDATTHSLEWGFRGLKILKRLWNSWMLAVEGVSQRRRIVRTQNRMTLRGPSCQWKGSTGPWLVRQGNGWCEGMHILLLSYLLVLTEWPLACIHDIQCYCSRCGTNTPRMLQNVQNFNKDFLTGDSFHLPQVHAFSHFARSLRLHS